MTDWVEHEFQEVELGDKRLSYRLKLCVSQAARMGESTPDRARSKADLKATYRLVDNPKVSMDEILSQHNQSTRQRCSAYKRIYLVQDTTEVDLTKPRQRVEGAGPLGTDKRQGFFIIHFSQSPRMVCHWGQSTKWFGRVTRNHCKFRPKSALLKENGLALRRRKAAVG
jgi:hypothetical protein